MSSDGVVSQYASGARHVWLQAAVVRFTILLSCIVGTSIAVYPEGTPPHGGHSASRTTEMPRKAVDVSGAPLLTEDMVNSWVSRWQRRLGMEDWKIESRIVRLSSLPRGTVANIHWSLPKRTATIKVLDPVDSTLPRSEIVRDTELSVVHELVHLSMAKLPLDANNTELEEETVKKISTALLSLDKQDDQK